MIEKMKHQTRVIALFSTVALLLAMIPMSVFASDTTDFNDVIAELNAISIPTEISKVADITLPTASNGVAFTWALTSQTVSGSIVLTGNSVTAVNPPTATVDTTYAATTFNVTQGTTGMVSANNDGSYVTLTATATKGSQSVSKPFFTVVKRAIDSNLYIDNADHGKLPANLLVNSATIGTYTLMDTTNVANNTSNKYKKNYVTGTQQLKYGFGDSNTYANRFVTPVNAGNVQSASYRTYCTGTGNNFNFRVKSFGGGTSDSLVFANIRVTGATKINGSGTNNAIKVYVNYINSGTGTTGLTQVTDTSAGGTNGTAWGIPINTWIEFKVVTAFGMDSSAQGYLYDLYVYSVDYSNGAKTLLAKQLAIPGAKTNATNAVAANKAITSLYFDDWNVTNYFDDISITDYTVDVARSKANLALPTTITNGTKLPTKGIDGTQISWTTATGGVSIDSNNVITTTSGSNVSDVALTATISKGELLSDTNAIKASDTKPITVATLAVPQAPASLPDTISVVNASGNNVDSMATASGTVYGKFTHNTSATVNGILIIASYNASGDLINVAHSDVANATTTTVNGVAVSGATHIKVFLWDGTVNATPLMVSQGI